MLKDSEYKVEEGQKSDQVDLGRFEVERKMSPEIIIEPEI